MENERLRLFEGSIAEFKEEVLDNKIAETLTNNYYLHTKRRAGQSEIRAWDVSLRVLKDSIDAPELAHNKIVVEYRLPYSDRRIDVLLFGKNNKNEDSMILIELKQWSNDKVENCEIQGNVKVDYGKFIKEQAHPSRQVEGYVVDMIDFIKVFRETPALTLEGCAYCHNYHADENAVLFQPKFRDAIKKYPIFSKEDRRKLGEYITERIANGDGLEVFDRFINSPIKASKKLMDHVGDMIKQQQIFNLIDDQIAAYNAIMDRAGRQVKTGEKSVIIIKGGPGTGKSVIALAVMGELLKQGKDVFHATGSSAFTKNLRDIIGKHRKSAEEHFKYFYAFTKTKDDSIDVLICDEAHRLRKDSNDWGVPSGYKSKNPQIDDLIRPAKVSVFFIDEYQVVRPNEIGSVSLIRESAKKFGVKESNIHEFELLTQFRCSGSDAYLQWLENVLGIRESEVQTLTKDIRMEFRVFDDPVELKKAIDAKNAEKKNCARIVAGFCWPWSKPNQDGSLVNDVKVGKLELPWERKDQFWKWARYDEGMNQVGTVYTAQGFEFDYIGVIFSKDLIYDKIKQEWIAKPENSQDGMAKRGNKQFAQHLKNVYRVLMSRAHKGVYVYFVDRDTREFFESKIEKWM